MPKPPNMPTAEIASKTANYNDGVSLRKPPQNTIKRCFEWLSGIAVIVGLVCAYFQFAPWIHVEPISYTFTEDWRDAKFQITNESPIPLYNVFYYASLWDGDKPGNTMGGKMYSIGKLKPHVPISAKIESLQPLLNPFNGETVDLTKTERPMMQLQVIYSPFGISFLQTQTVRVFWAYRTKGGQAVWCPAGGGDIIRGDQPLPQLTPLR